MSVSGGVCYQLLLMGPLFVGSVPFLSELLSGVPEVLPDLLALHRSVLLPVTQPGVEFTVMGSKNMLSSVCHANIHRIDYLSLSCTYPQIRTFMKCTVEKKLKLE